MKKRNDTFSCLVMLFFFLLFIIGTIRSFLPGDPNYLRVVRVVDGDTFVAECIEGSETRIRLIGVDAPEARARGNRAEEYYGDEAKEFLEDLIENRRVRLEYDEDIFDRYDRVLAYVYLRNNTFVNAKVIERGYAEAALFPPNDRYYDMFVELEREARMENRGMWR